MKKILTILIVVMFAVSGCKFTLAPDLELTRKIEAWQKAYPDREGDCGIETMKRCYHYEKQGIPARFYHGWFKGQAHAWCEYYDKATDRWLVDDPSIWYINKGYPREAYKSAGVCDYKVKWWGEDGTVLSDTETR